ncbi:MAG: ceramidase domain-containing protein [Xanthomonadaceae bacterium]|nr:ceramidase domain-containing protein [Xanthomonadaceae bacterium]
MSEYTRPVSQRIIGWREGLLLAISLAVCAALIAHGPIAQDQDYHRFADARPLCGISNFWNVVTNLPFLLFGGWGLNVLYRRRTAALPMRTAYATFFVGASAVAFGSAYYHLDPSDATLVWDRLPMTIAFMAFFAALVGRHIRSTLGERALLPLLLIGLLSVVWWRAVGDLRPYLAVQFLPILLIPAMLLMYPTNARGTRYFWVVLGLYALAKALETYDASVYGALGMSGHALKHLSAALGVACVALAVRAQMPETQPRSLEG